MSTYDPNLLQKQLLAAQAHKSATQVVEEAERAEWTAAMSDILRDLRERASREAVALPVDRNGRRQFDRYQGLIAALFEAEGRARCLSIEGHPKP